MLCGPCFRGISGQFPSDGSFEQLFKEAFCPFFPGLQIHSPTFPCQVPAHARLGQRRPRERPHLAPPLCCLRRGTRVYLDHRFLGHFIPSLVSTPVPPSLLAIGDLETDISCSGPSSPKPPKCLWTSLATASPRSHDCEGDPLKP